MNILQAVRNSFLTKVIASFLAILILEPWISVNPLRAASGGPTQPEYSAFTAVSASDLVDPFTGNMGYSVPLFDVGGYPVTLSYTGDIGMEQDAGWVGLGWSLNVGSINRGLRGVPDEFNGTDKLKQTEKLRPRVRVEVGLNRIKKEMFVLQENGGEDSTEITKLKALGVSISYDNYTGLGIGYSASLNKATDKFKFFKYVDTIPDTTSHPVPAFPFATKTKIVNNIRTTFVQLYRASSKFQMGFAYDSKSGLNADLPIEGLMRKSQLLQAVGSFIGVPSNIGINSRSGKINAGLTWGQSNSKLNFTYSPDFVVNPSFIAPPSRLYEFNQTLTFDFSTPKGTNPRTISLRGDVSAAYLKSTNSEFPMYGLLYMKKNPGVLYQDREPENIAMFDVQEQPKYIDKFTKELPSSAIYADVFSIAGAGIGGSFRLQDNTVVMYGPGSQRSNPTLNAIYLKGEIGSMASENEFGADVGVTLNRQNYDPLEYGDFQNERLPYYPTLPQVNNTFQPAEFRNDFEFIEANNRYYNGFHWDTLSYIGIPQDKILSNRFLNQFQAVTNKKEMKMTGFDVDETISKGKRDARQQVVTYLKAEEAAVHGFSKKIKSYAIQIAGVDNMVLGPDGLHTFVVSEIDRESSTGPRKEHHISEFTVLQPDGSRYYYGTPVYNYFEKEYEFNVSNNLLPSQSSETVNRYDYLRDTVSYTTADLTNNKKGIDYSFKERVIPSYAHSYLLNAVLSSDYVDKTGDGPSEDDIGNYVKFNYTMTTGTTSASSEEAEGFLWRSLAQVGTADLAQGNKSDVQDDRASFTYGKKEMWYLHSIETKDQIALFYLKPRLDGFSVSGRDGGVNFFGNDRKQQYYLHHIAVFSKEEFKKNGAFMGEPLKVIHLQYSYDLCQSYSYNIKNSGVTGAPINPDGLLHPITGQLNDFNRGGKLTLHKIWVTYGKQSIPTSAPYVFEYGTSNPNYSYKAMDRWGVYQPLKTGSNSINTEKSGDLPYTNQNATTANANASAWMLSDITLPSGGKITVEYESDQYGFVQDREAMQMLKIKGIADNPSYNSTDPDNNKLFTASEKFTMANPRRRFIIVEKPSGVSNISDIVDKEELMYYNFMVKLSRDEAIWADERFEAINGFFEIEEIGDINSQYGYIKMKPEMAGIWSTSPIVRNSLQQGLARAPFIFYPGSDWMRSNLTFGSDKFISMLLGSVTESISMLINKYQYFMTRNFCKVADLNRSYIRTKCANGVKYGGGHRVKSVTISDNWSSMTSSAEATASYTMDYTYLTEKNKTSGVASYEPLIGGDENPLKYPKVAFRKNIYGKIKEEHKTRESQGIQPANISYDLGPVGEEYFPSPVVGYSRVTVKTRYPNTNIKRHKTGYSVQEFYTAKDFPIYSEASVLEKKQTKIGGPKITSPANMKDEQQSTTPAGAEAKKKKGFQTRWGLDVSAEVQNSIASQGFKIELNDMHGKPKASLVYTEDGKEPFSGSRYFYKVDGNGNLENHISVVRENGNINEIQAGVSIEPIMFGSKSASTVHSIRPNMNLDLKGTVPIIGITLGYALKKENSRAISFTKVIRRVGIVDKVVVYDKGAETSTKNIAWDALTGQVLITSVKNEYSDLVYSLTKPAHWMYKGLQGAYQNIGTEVEISIDANGECPNPNGILFPGDELVETDLNNTERYWVLDRDDETEKVSIIDEDGYNPAPIIDPVKMKIIRSGYRNILGAGAETVTLKSLPIATVNGKQILRIPSDQVIAGKGITFDDHRQVYQKYRVCYTIGCEFDPETQQPYPGLRNALMSNLGPCTESVNSNSTCIGGGYDFGDEVNPFILGIMGVWKPFGDYAYHDKRNQYALRTQTEASGSYDANATNIRYDGLLKNYKEFWYRNENGWYCRMEKDTANPWTWMETIENTDERGNHVQSVNALGIYSTVLYGYNDRRLAIAVGANAQHRELLSENFEDIDENAPFNWVCNNGILQTQPPMNQFNADFCEKVRHWPVAQLFMNHGNEISTAVSHTGWKSLKLNKGTSDVKLINQPSGQPTVQDYYTQYSLHYNDFLDRFKPITGKPYVISLWVRENVRDQLELQITDAGNPVTLTQEGTPYIINGWKKLTYRFTVNSVNVIFKFINHGATGQSAGNQYCYVDDIRIHPANGSMQAYVYDWSNYRLMSTLDDNNFAVFFEYDEEGALVRKKVETERGVMTVDENRNNLRR